ncbi:hypothetical protein SE17_01700 [Kouleothrix aurantiaca]|uniref:Uncharacterized protein n=1 Tax=Kouleothrix aurantiaca TaxID=186479 RepID=A0A0P9D6Y7_9CHLR|nr:hypothetical protein SE17_01700 [Kouleothrix aurantiaca]
MNVSRFDPDLGRLFTPAHLFRSHSLPGAPIRRQDLREIGVVTAVQKRARVIDLIDRNGVLIPVIDAMEILWHSISHNERVDAGASYQAKQVFAAGSSPGAPSATVYFNVIAVASATLTKAKGDQSLGSTSSGVTTNEFTTIGLSRATANTPVGGDYTAPSSLGGTFTQNVAKTFTASGSGTAYGAGLLNSTTVAGSILYIEDNFGSTAVLVSGDTLTVTVAMTN